MLQGINLKWIVFFCKISYFGLWWSVVQLILVGGDWKPPKLTKFCLKFCPQGFGLAAELGVWTHGGRGLDSRRHWKPQAAWVLQKNFLWNYPFKWKSVPNPTSNLNCSQSKPSLKPPLSHSPAPLPGMRCWAEQCNLGKQFMGKNHWNKDNIVRGTTVPWVDTWRQMEVPYSE